MTKPGTMAKDGTLYDPVADFRFRPGPDDRAWDGGRLRFDRYHAAQRFRPHQDGREVNLEINYLCRYACRHCFQSLRPDSYPEATPDAAAVIAAAERVAAAEEISITGGDIFLQPAVWEALDFLQERAPRATIRLLVNGGGFDDEVRRRLARLEGRRIIVKSDFYGHNPRLHDEFTGVPGSFDRLVRIARFLRETGIAFVAAAALTRADFETRFELVGFLGDLTEDRFTVASAIHPGRSADEARLLPEQFAELMEERFFAPLAAEYHSFEPQCAGDCQFAVVSANGKAWGCSFLKLDSEPIAAWRERAVAAASTADCATCSARATCRRCPSFLAARDSYCRFVRLAHPGLLERVRRAQEEGFAFVHPGRS
ncbi:MAG: radical SAM protein [Planctomycetes bacterium]|nr:radical SAM protein [Planctomycetota bacterium]